MLLVAGATRASPATREFLERVLPMRSPPAMLCYFFASAARRPSQLAPPPTAAHRSACPAIDRSRKRRFPLLEGTGDEHRVRAVRTEGHVGDIRRRHLDHADQLAVLVHDEDAARAVLRDVVIAVRTELQAVRAVIGV